MKKNLLTKLLFCLFVLTMYSCGKEYFNENFNRPVELSSRQIKAYYDTLKVNKVFQLAGTKIPVASLIMPDWNAQVNGNRGEYEYIEVPISLSRKEVNLYEMDPGRKQNSKARVENSFSTLLFYKKGDAEILTSMVTYIPNDDYVATHGRPINQNRMNNLDKQFSGYIEYKELNGKVKAVVKVVNGLSVMVYNTSQGSASPISASGRIMSTSPKTKPEEISSFSGCFPICTPIFQTICAGPAGAGTGFDEDIMCETKQIGENCTWICSGGGDIPIPGGPGGSGGGGTTDPVDPYKNDKFDIDGCMMVLDIGDMEFDEGEPLPEDHDPIQNPPKAKINHRFVSPNGTVFTEWTDNSGRVHVHANMGSYYKGFLTNLRSTLISVGTSVDSFFDFFKEGKFAFPVSWQGFYTAQAEYIYGEMGEYYKDKKERNKKNGGSPCQK